MFFLNVTEAELAGKGTVPSTVAYRSRLPWCEMWSFKMSNAYRRTLRYVRNHTGKFHVCPCCSSFQEILFSWAPLKFL